MIRFLKLWLCPALIFGGLSLSARELTLDTAIAEALEKNFEIRIETLNPANARDELKAEQGEFLPFLYWDWNRSSIQKYQNSIDFTSRNGIRRWEDENWTTKSGIGGKLPTGTSYEVYYSIYSTRNSLNSAAPSTSALFRPEIETFVGFKLSQPLLRNFGTKVNTAGLRLAKIQIAVNDLQREVLINNKALEVANAYYDLLFASNDRQVKAEALETARQFLDYTRELVSVGKAADIDIAQAEVNVSEARERWILATNSYQRGLVALVREIGGTVNAAADLPEYALPAVVVPTQTELDVASLIESAFAHRADLHAAESESQQSRIRSHYASNQRLPELNVEFSYGFNGFGGTTDDSFTLLREMDEPQWTVGLLFRMPLIPVKEASLARIARRKNEQAKLTTEMRRSHIALEVRNAVDRITLFRERRETATQSVAFARKALEVERERFANGRTNNYAILEMQDRLAAARTRELAATIDLIKAGEELHAVTGALLYSHGFQLERSVEVAPMAAAAPRPSHKS